METEKVKHGVDFASRADETAERYCGFHEATKMHVVDWDPRAEKAKREESARIATEHQRLKDDVINAARADRKAETKAESESYGASFEKLLHARRAFRLAVSALMQFETDHGMEQ